MSHLKPVGILYMNNLIQRAKYWRNYSRQQYIPIILSDPDSPEHKLNDWLAWRLCDWPELIYQTDYIKLNSPGDSCNIGIWHCNDVIISAMAPQITSLTIVYSTVYSRSKKTSKPRVTDLSDRNSPVTGEFPARRANNAENVQIQILRNRVRPLFACQLFNRLEKKNEPSLTHTRCIWSLTNFDQP